jgi:hypothetical protein
LMVTPNDAEYIKGLWRAKKQGRSHLPWWDDLSLNRVFLGIACTVVLATATTAGSVVGEDQSSAVGGGSLPGNFPLAIAIGVLVVAYFGMALQYFLLRFGRRGVTYFALFLFLAWLVPLMAGTIMAMASMSGEPGPIGAFAFSLSPVPGIWMVAASVRDESYRTSIQSPAITPALLFTFVFNSLLISARRRAYKAFLSSAGRSEKRDTAQSAINLEQAQLDTGSPGAQREGFP